MSGRKSFCRRDRPWAWRSFGWRAFARGLGARSGRGGRGVGAGRVVAETNQGGEMVTSVLRGVEASLQCGREGGCDGLDAGGFAA